MSRRNKLYFESHQVGVGRVRYWWVLKTSEGRILAKSHETWKKKSHVIRNCVELFGLEILENTHHLHEVSDRES